MLPEMPSPGERHEMADPNSPTGCGLLGLLHAPRDYRWSRSPRPTPVSTPARQPPKRCNAARYTAIVIRPTKLPTVVKANLIRPRAPPPYSKISAAGSKPVPDRGISGDLDSFLFDHEKTNIGSQLVRATSGNVLLNGDLGNLRSTKRIGYGHGGAEELKEAGNEEYRKGRFAEALALYERAIVLDSGKASYRSNKAAALAGSGRLVEAVAECKEALRLDRNYTRARTRLAGLYSRLGEIEKAIHHYKLCQADISRAEALRSHFIKCSEARKLRDWQTVVKESRHAVLLGADSSPRVFAWQAEALMKLHKHSEAEAVMKRAPKFDIDASTKLFGVTVNGYVLLIQAQVDLASGRFDEAVVAAQKGVQLDPNDREISTFARRARVVASARSRGNDLFKLSRFQDACLAYSEGLDSDPHNAILLCNRAASRAKLRQWEKAVEDCNSALRFRPLYTKARLRRADCNSKLKRWQASIRDYEILIKEIPGDKEIEKTLMEAKSQLRKKGKLVEAQLDGVTTDELKNPKTTLL